MNAAATIARPLPASRRRCLVFPREHGAWGMLFVPLVTGALVALRGAAAVLPLGLLVVAAFALFCLRTPLEALLGTSAVRACGESERSLASSWAVIYAATAGLAISVLFQFGYARGLLLVGAPAAAAFVLQAFLRARGRAFRLASQTVGAAGLAATSAAAYYVAAGQLDRTALALWAMNFVFAAGQVHYVHVFIRHARVDGCRRRLSAAPGFAAGLGLLAIAAALAARGHVLPILAVVALAPAVLRGFAWYFAPAGTPDPHRLGFHELAHAVAFGLLVVLSFRF